MWAFSICPANLSLSFFFVFFFEGLSAESSNAPSVYIPVFFDLLRGTMTLLGQASNLPEAPLLQRRWQGYRVKSDKRDGLWNRVRELVCLHVSVCVCFPALDTDSACSNPPQSYFCIHSPYANLW